MKSETEIVKKLVDALDSLIFTIHVTAIKYEHQLPDLERDVKAGKQALTEAQAWLERQGKCGEGDN